MIDSLVRFQSTPPARAATKRLTLESVAWDSFNPRRPRGRRLSMRGLICERCHVSIHAAREGGDAMNTSKATYCKVSIHAAREGGDYQIYSEAFIVHGFNPRRPRGRRPCS